MEQGGEGGEATGREIFLGGEERANIQLVERGLPPPSPQ